MQVKKTLKSTTATLSIIATDKELNPIKDHVLTHFQDRVKIPGFRAGKAPLNMVEKHVDQTVFQSEFLEEAISMLYSEAVRDNDLRVVSRPEIKLSKFVPYTTLEFTAEVPVVGEITLGDYKKLKVARPKVEVSADDVKDVIESLRTRMAEKKDVDRAAKDTDQVWIDFSGVDEKGEPVKGADGKDYPLVLGSNTFIPGFEPNLVGLKAGDEKTFTLTFPKDYGVKALANRKVTFTVTVTKVQEVVKPKVDDEFAAKVGPFKTAAELKADIKKQVGIERQNQADRDYESEVVKKLSDKSKVEIPEVLVDEQIERMMQELQQNLMYRGQTIQEFLEQEGKTEQQYRDQELKPQATERVKAGLVLAEVADQEKIQVTPQEVDIRIQVLKGQYQDQAMQAELDKPENRRDITSRLLTEKTLAKLVSYASK